MPAFTHPRCDVPRRLPPLQAAAGIALPLYLDEYDATGLYINAGTPINTVALPTASCTLATGSVDDSTNGHYWYDTEGLMTQSTSGRVLALPCYKVAPGSKITDASTTIKTIAVVAADGTIDVSTTSVRPYGGTAGELVALHAVATVDGASFYTSEAPGFAGSGYGGFYLVTLGAASATGTAISYSSGYPGYNDARGVGIYGTGLYGTDRQVSQAAARHSM